MSTEAGDAYEGPPEGYTGEATVRGLQATVECIETIRSQLTDRVALAVPNNTMMAQAIMRQLALLRSLLNADGPGLDVTRTVARTSFVELIMTNAPTLLRFENVTDECLRVLAPLTRLCGSGSSNVSAADPEAAGDAATLQRDIMSQMLRSGGVVFVLLALRGYMNTSLGIRLQGLELLATMLEFCALSASEGNAAEEAVDSVPKAATTEAEAAGPATPSASPSSPSTSGKGGAGVNTRKDEGQGKGSPGGQRFDYAGSEALRYGQAAHQNAYGGPEARQALRSLTVLPDNQMALDAVHQLLLHGAGVVLVRMLHFSVAAKSEVSVRRAVWCLRFLLLGTPASLAFKVASYDQYACLRALASQLRVPGNTTRLEVAVLLTGLLASKVEVASALTRLGGWDELSSVLASSAEHVCVPPQWLRKSLENIRLLDSTTVEIGDPRNKRPAGVPGKRNNGADDISAVETAILHTRLLQTSADTQRGMGGLTNDSMISGGASLEDVVTSLLTKTYESARQRSIRWSRPGSRSGGGGRLARPGSHGGGGMNRSKSQTGGVTLGSSMGGAASMPDLLGGNGASPGKKDKHDILNGKFAQGIKESPLGQPVDPEKIRKLRKENGGKLPQHVPFAFGGPKIGSRPGPDYGSKTKKREVAGSGLGQSRPGSANPLRPGHMGDGKGSRPQSASGGFGPLSTTAELYPDQVLPTEGVPEGKRATVKKVRAAGFLAKKLFDVDDKSSTSGAGEKDTAVNKLNFAERLQCMIMQVQELT